MSVPRPYPKHLLLHAGFVLTGMVTTLLGPILPALAARWSFLDSQAGALFTAQFVGSTIGVGLSSVVLPRLGFRVCLGLGFAAMASGVFWLGVASSAMGMASIFCYGIGIGLTIPATNLFVAQSNPDRSAAALNVLNLAWGIGAVAWPSLARWQGEGSSAALFGLGGALALIGVALVVFISDVGSATAPLGQAVVADGGPSDGRRLLVFASLFFLYVGTENAIGGWGASLARRLNAESTAAWSLTPSLFWGMLLLGRALAPALLRRMTEATLAVGGVLLASLATAILGRAASLTSVGIAVALAGLGLASVFPIVVALMARSFGSRASRVAGGMFALAGLGGATLPWLVGIVSTRLGGLEWGLTVPLVGSLAMAALLLDVRRTGATK